MKRPDQPQPLTLTEAIIPVGSLIALVALSYFLFGDAGAVGPNQVALAVATMLAVFIGWRRGHSLESLGKAATESVATGIGAIFILFAVGALIGTWAMSGTLVAMVYYGLQLLSPNYFYVTACAICGSRLGQHRQLVDGRRHDRRRLHGHRRQHGAQPGHRRRRGDLGRLFRRQVVAALGLGQSRRRRRRRRPLSRTSGRPLLTSLVALAISMGVFFLLGQPGDYDATAKLDAIRAAFHISPVLFLPLAVVVVLALFRAPPFTAIFLGAIAGGVLAVIMAPERVIRYADAGDLPSWLALLKGVWLALASGYTSTTGFAPMDMLATRGGMDSMLNTIWLIVTALAFGGVVEKAGVLERLITPIIEKAKSDGALVASLASSIVATNVITADQYIAIVLPGRMFKSAFQRRGLAPVVLSRTVGDTATPTSALIPWNSCGAYMAATLGVATWSYAPFAVFSIVSPLLTVAIAYAGIRMLRVPAAAAAPPAAPAPVDRDSGA